MIPITSNNCLSCTQYFSCSDGRKSAIYMCRRYESVMTATLEKQEVTLAEAVHFQQGELAELLETPDSEDMVFSLEREFQAALDSNRSLPRDLVLGDLDLWEAPNFYEMCFDTKGLGVRPFARQLWVGLKLFGEVCPYCSDPKWFHDVTAIPVDYRSVDLPERLQLLSYGKCPSCKRGRARMYRKKKLPIYMELAMCVSGSSRVATKDGLLPIKDIEPEGRCHSGRQPRDYYNWKESGVKEVYRTRTKTGHCTETSADHQHLTWLDGKASWVRQGSLMIGSNLILRLGYSNPIKDYLALDLPDVDVQFSRTEVPRKPTHLTEAFAYLLGLWESDGHYSTSCDSVLTNTNEAILAKAISCIKEVFGVDVSYSVKVSGVAGQYNATKTCYQVALRNKQACSWLNMVGSGKPSVDNFVPHGLWKSPDSVVLAYLAGYYDGDGCQSSKHRMRRLGFHTFSVEQGRGIHLLLTRLGVMSYNRPGFGVVVEGKPLAVLSSLLSPYLVREIDTPKLKEQQSGYYGIPATEIWELLDSKLVSSSRKNARYTFRNGHTEHTANWSGFRWIFTKMARTKFLCPYKAQDGYYDDLIRLVTVLSPDLGGELMSMIQNRWVVSSVQGIASLGKQATYDISVDTDESFLCNGVVVHNCVGQRAGKSLSTSMFNCYHLHKLLSMVRPAEFYGQTRSTTLSHTYTALQLNRAIALLWTPIRAMMEDSPWFQSYFHEMQERGARIGEELIVVKDTYVNFRRARVMARPVSPNRGTLRGDTRCVVGSALVNTSNGLQRLDCLAISKKKHTTETALFGHMRGDIVDWVCKGAKPIVRVFLENGLSLEMTPDHKVLTRTEGQFRWIPAADLMGKAVVVSLADSGFPENDGLPWMTDASLRHVDPNFFLSCSRDVALRYLRAFAYGMTQDETQLIFQCPDYRLLQQVLLRFGYLSHYDSMSGLLFLTDEDTECIFGEWAQLGLLRVEEGSQTLSEMLRADPKGAATAIRSRRIKYERKRSMAAVRCVAIAGAGTAPVYDITVDHDRHAFSANGLIVKNCGGSIDELGWFKVGDGADEAVTISADETYASIANSLTTIRTAANRLLEIGENNVQQGIMFNVSSPKSAFDKITTLVRKNRDSRLVLALSLPTWEYNPQVKREDLEIYFANDPVKAERDYGANPPLSSSCFFENHDAIRAMFQGPRNRVSYRKIERVLKNGTVEMSAIVESTKLPSVLEPAILSIDAGHTNNSFALTVLSAPSEDIKKMASARGLNLKGVVHAQVEVIPPKAGKVNHKHVLKNVIYPLIKAFNVQAVVADRWQSILLLDILRDGDPAENLDPVHVEVYTMRMNDFIAVKSYCEGGAFLFPRPETEKFNPAEVDVDNYPHCMQNRPVDHCMVQFCTVVETGRTVDKGEGFTDDVFRSFAVGATFLLDEEWVKAVLKAKKRSGTGGGLGAIAGGGGNSSTNVAGVDGRAMVAIGSGGGVAGSVFARSK